MTRRMSADPSGGSFCRAALKSACMGGVEWVGAPHAGPVLWQCLSPRTCAIGKKTKKNEEEKKRTR